MSFYEREWLRPRRYTMWDPGVGYGCEVTSELSDIAMVKKFGKDSSFSPRMQSLLPAMCRMLVELCEPPAMLRPGVVAGVAGEKLDAGDPIWRDVDGLFRKARADSGPKKTAVTDEQHKAQFKLMALLAETVRQLLKKKDVYGISQTDDSFEVRLSRSQCEGSRDMAEVEAVEDALNVGGVTLRVRYK